jgi:hypothetical protein
MSNFLERFPTAESFAAFYENRLPGITTEIQWTTGGQMGGSCWDEGPAEYYPVEADKEPENEDIEKLLENAVPDLTFFEYKRLVKIPFEIREDGHYNEYYGNSRSYTKKTVDLEVLYNGLREIVQERG